MVVFLGGGCGMGLVGDRLEVVGYGGETGVVDGGCGGTLLGLG